MWKRFLYHILPSFQRVDFKIDPVGGALLDETPDSRDYPSPLLGTTETGSFFTLRSKNLTPVQNQLNLNSCVAQAVSTAIETYSLENGWPHHFELSPLYIWFYGRQLSGTFPDNDGMFIRDAWKAVRRHDMGATIEKLYPYNTRDYNQEPGIAARMFRKWHKPFYYYWISGSKEDKEEKTKQVLIEKRVPIVFAVPLSDSFMRLNTTEVYKPQSSEPVRFYHAMLITGFDNNRGAFEIMNSWGRSWGNQGFLWVDKNWLLEEGYNLSYPDKL